MLLHVVADYGEGDLAFAEIAQRFLAHLDGARLVYTPVPPFATLASGFAVAQLVLNDGPAAMAVFQNVAPRRDDRSARPDNDGEKLLCARTTRGHLVMGPNSGFSFSFLKEAGCELRLVAASSRGSQFRSRDIFAGAFARLLSGEDALLAGAPADEAVPEPPAAAIAYVDGFGNIKTTVRRVPFEPGRSVVVTIAGVEREAVVAGGGFEVPDGVLALAPGSSGWPLTDGSRVRFYELFLRGGSAWQEFGKPPVESMVDVRVKVA